MPWRNCALAELCLGGIVPWRNCDAPDRFGPGVSSRLDGALRQGSWGLSAGCSGGPASAGHLRVRLPCLQLHMSTKIPLFKCLLPGFPNPLIDRLLFLFHSSYARAVHTGRLQDAGKHLFHLQGVPQMRRRNNHHSITIARICVLFTLPQIAFIGMVFRTQTRRRIPTYTSND